MIVRAILLLTGLILLFACEKSQSPILDIENVVDKTPQQVEAILGRPDTSYTQTIVTKHIFTQIYKDEFDIEIMYPDGLATDIVVLNGAPKLPFEASILNRFGLKEITPSHVLEKSYIKWKNYPGFKTINFFVTDLDSAGQVEQFRLFFKSDGK